MNKPIIAAIAALFGVLVAGSAQTQQAQTCGYVRQGDGSFKYVCAPVVKKHRLRDPGHDHDRPQPGPQPGPRVDPDHGHDWDHGDHDHDGPHWGPHWGPAFYPPQPQPQACPYGGYWDQWSRWECYAPPAPYYPQPQPHICAHIGPLGICADRKYHR